MLQARCLQQQKALKWEKALVQGAKSEIWGPGMPPEKNVVVGTGTEQFVVPETSSAGERDDRSCGGQMCQHGAGEGKGSCYLETQERAKRALVRGQGANGE